LRGRRNTHASQARGPDLTRGDKSERYPGRASKNLTAKTVPATVLSSQGSKKQKNGVVTREFTGKKQVTKKNSTGWLTTCQRPIKKRKREGEQKTTGAGRTARAARGQAVRLKDNPPDRGKREKGGGERSHMAKKVE